MKPSRSALVQAVRDLRAADVADMLRSAPALLAYRDERGCNLKLAAHLLRRGSDPNHCLWTAAFHDDLAAIRLLLASGAAIDAIAEDETPFLGAVKVSHFEPARLLLENGADPDFRDSRGMTALHYMLKKGSETRHFALLARHGARGDIPDGDGKTAAELLARKRDPELKRIAGLLARAPADGKTARARR